MTQEEKFLLFKDLCARTPYGVKVNIKGIESKPLGCKVIAVNVVATTINVELLPADIEVEFVKPYLRPMSSMTEEESNELESITFPLMEKDWDGNENPACIIWTDIPKYMDFILSHHFDYLGLIDKGLAIEVTKENNPYKE